MRNNFHIIGDNRSEPAFPFRYSVAPIIKNIHIQPQVPKHLEIGNQLIGEHGIALRHQEVTLGARDGEPIAAQLLVVAGLEADLLQIFYMLDALRVGRARRAAP